MARPRLKGSTDQSVTLYIVDDTDGTPEQGVVYNTASIALWYRREGAAKVAMSLVTLASASASHTDSGLIHVDDGVYRIDLPDAAFASGAGEVVVGGSVPDMVVLPVTIPLVDYDNQDAANLGLSDITDILADTNELQSDDVPGLIAALDIVVDRVEADTQSIEAKVDTIDGIVDDILVDTGTTIPATITTIDSEIGTVDTVVDAIKVATDKMVFTTSNQLDVQVLSMATDSITASAAAADFIGASEIAASASTEIADLIAADWVAGDASPLAIVAALKADSEWSNLATIDANIDLILEDTGTSLPATLTTIDNELAVIDGIVDDILVDTAEIGTAGAGLTAIEASVPNLLLSTTINAVTDNQNFTLVAGPPDNDVMNGHMIKVTDQTTGTQFGTARIADYVASGFDVDLETSPGFDVAAGDIVEVFASPNRIALVDVVTTNSDMISAESVNAEVDDALSDYDAPKLNELQNELATLNNVSLSQVRTQMDGALLDLHLDHLFAADYNPAVKPGVATSWANEVVVSDGGVTQFSANALELAPSGGGSGSDATLLQSTTINALADGTSQTTWTLSAGSGDNDSYNDRLCVITDQTTATQKCVVRITDYVGSSKTVTCSTPGFTIAAGDTVHILAITALTESEVNAQADLALTDIGLDHLVSASVAGADVADNSIVGQMVAADGDWDTFAKATDSLDSIRANLPSSAGTGAYTVAITVTDTASPANNIQSATVTLTEGVNQYTATTTVAGVATLNLGNATYTYSIAKSGYAGATGTILVEANTTATKTMAANTTPPAASPNFTTGKLTCYNETGALEPGAIIHAQLTAGSGTAGESLDTKRRELTAHATTAVVEIPGMRWGTTWSIWRAPTASNPTSGLSIAPGGSKVRVVVPTSGSEFDIAEVIGADE